MKRFILVMAFCLLAFVPVVHAAGPDDEYITIYGLIEQGNSLGEKGQLASAMAKYLEAQTALRRFRVAYPDWNTKVVSYRLVFLDTRISEISSQAPKPAVTNAPVKAESGSPVATSPVVENPTLAARDQIARLEADKVLLESKLKEALAAQPAAADPREFAKAQDQINELRKENELLKASLTEAKLGKSPTPSRPAAPTTLKPVEVEKAVARLTDANATLASERDEARAQLQSATRQIAQLQAEKAGAGAKVGQSPATGAPTTAFPTSVNDRDPAAAKLKEANAALVMERDALQARVKMLSTSDTSSASLREENENLKRQVAETKAKGGTTVPALTDSVTADRIRQLEAQRDELQKDLDAATKGELGKKKGKQMAGRVEELTRELAGLRARVEVYDARAVPFTADELALLSEAPTSITPGTQHGKKPAKQLPGNGAVLLAQAQKAVVAGQLDKAEDGYLAILKLDPKNTSTLDDLASIQIELNHEAEAEKHLLESLAIDPNDDYTLYVVGKLRLHQKNYDEALNVLGRAAQANPQGSQIQTELGVALSEKGLRGPAEAAFRRAVELDANNAPAHFKLAVIYASQTPPLIELAKWHYQKALTAGYPADPKLEKLLDQARNAN